MRARAKSARADVNSRDNRSGTPLHTAAAKGFRDVAELLLANQAEVNARDKDGLTPLDYATSKGNKDMAELLRKHGATNIPPETRQPSKPKKGT